MKTLEDILRELVMDGQALLKGINTTGSFDKRFSQAKQEIIKLVKSARLRDRGWRGNIDTTHNDYITMGFNQGKTTQLNAILKRLGE